MGDGGDELSGCYQMSAQMRRKRHELGLGSLEPGKSECVGHDDGIDRSCGRKNPLRVLKLRKADRFAPRPFAMGARRDNDPVIEQLFNQEILANRSSIK